MESTAFLLYTVRTYGEITTALIYIPDEWAYKIAQKTAFVKTYAKDAIEQKMKKDGLIK